MAELMEVEEDRHTILKAAIEIIISHDSGRDSEELQDAVGQFQTSAQEVGIESDDIVVLVRCICTNYDKIGLATCGVIISSLVPRDSVPDVVFVRAISWACTETAPVNLLVKLFQWMVAMLEYANTKVKVHSTYTVLFHLLKTVSIRPYVYKLLSELTGKGDVTANRVDTLMELRKLPDAEQYASSLLALFKSYKPELITVKVPTKLARPPKFATNVWTKFVARIPSPRADVDFWHANDAFPDAVKNSRFGNDFPDINTDTEMVAVSEESSGNSTATSLQDVHSFDDFLKNIDSLKLHKSASTVLRYPILQHMISYQKDYAALTRIRLRLHGALVTDELCKQTPGRETDIAKKLLERTTHFVEYLQEGDPTVNTVLGRYMNCHWNGSDYAKLLLKLITHAPMLAVCQRLLEPLRKVFICSQVEYQVAVLKSITELVSNVVHTEWMLLQKVGADLDRYWADDRYYSLIVDQMSIHRLHPVNPDDDTVTLTLESIVEFVNFVDKLCIFAMTSSDCNVIVCHAVLNFYETAIQMNLSWQVPLVMVVPATIAHLLLFASDANSLSRMCQLFISYKTAIAKIDEIHQHFPRPWTREGLNAIMTVNVFVMETVDGLWRGKAFSKRDASTPKNMSVQCFPEEQFEELRLENMAESFTITRHHALAAFWYNFLKNRNESEKFTKSFILLKSENRHLVNDYMKYLTSCGLSGITNFLLTYVKMKL